MTKTAELAEGIEIKDDSERRATALALLDLWFEDSEDDPAEQKATGDALLDGLNESRRKQRLLFPADCEGRTW